MKNANWSSMPLPLVKSRGEVSNTSQTNPAESSALKDASEPKDPHSLINDAFATSFKAGVADNSTMRRGHAPEKAKDGSLIGAFKKSLASNAPQKKTAMSDKEAAIASLVSNIGKDEEAVMASLGNIGGIKWALQYASAELRKDEEVDAVKDNESSLELVSAERRNDK